MIAKKMATCATAHLLLLACPQALFATPQTNTELFKQFPADLYRLDTYGAAVASSPTNILVGAIGPLDALSGYAIGPDPGKVYVVDPATGQQTGLLMTDSGVMSDWFGKVVAIDGDFALVGAKLDTANGLRAGAAYVFDLTTSQQHLKLLASNGDVSDFFGAGLAIGGNIAVVGAPGEDSQGSASGSAYVFDITTGQELQRLEATDGHALLLFGTSIAIHNGIAVIGAPGSGQSAGAAYVFDLTSFQQLYKIDAPAGRTADSFGRAVAITQTKVIVGASNKGGTGLNSPVEGYVMVYDLATGQQLHELRPPATSAEDLFGFSVSAWEDQAVIGAPRTELNWSSGKAYRFSLATGQLESTLVPSQPQKFASFGSGTSYSNGRIAVGAPYDTSASALSGALYVFGDASSNSGQGFCYGDGSGAACPCGNTGALGEGCASGLGRGARLIGLGHADTTNDTFRLMAIQLRPLTPGLFFQGPNEIALPMGDGLRCTDSALRYPVQFSNLAGMSSITGLGAWAAPGWTLKYQFWYRDASSNCGFGDFNFSNAWTVDW